MLTISSFVFIILLATMVTYWHSALFELVGSVVVVSAVIVAGACCLSSGRVWLVKLLRNVAKLAGEPTIEIINAEAINAEAINAEAINAEAKENARLRAQVVVLEQQLRSTEARERFSERARETDKKRHDKEVRHLDSQLAAVSRSVKETLRTKNQVLGECRHWRRKFEDLEDLQRQAEETPVGRRTQGRTRWDPPKNYGVMKRERTRPAKKLTVIAQVATVNAAWESRLASFENEARDYVTRTNGQIGSLHAAATALSEENANLKQQQIQAKPDISQELAQQQVDDAVRSIMELAEQKHKECVAALQQTHREELMAVKAEYEGRVEKETAVIKAKETQLGELRESTAKITGDLRVKKEETVKLAEELEQETARVVGLVQERDGHIRAGKKLEKKNSNLSEKCSDLAKENEDLKAALDDVADMNEEAEKKAHELECDNEVLQGQNAELFMDSVLKEMDHKKEVTNLENKVAASELTAAVQGFGLTAD